MYAIVEIGGFDYKVKPGDKITVNHQAQEVGAELEFTSVKLLVDEGDLKTSPDAKVKARVIGHRRGDKVLVYKFKKRKGYRRKQGHRDMLTDLEVIAVSKGSGSGK
ncbi:50S ribosomal protein L21 [candidate division WOR-3 bacterium]|nr:50S ribosomal protein L21 [candidate division WOR-3 bacterium]